MTIFFAVYAANWWETDGVAITLYIIWMAHYIHRSWIWPANARISGKQMPLLIVSFSIIFNSINAWLNAESVYRLNHPYPLEWFYSWQFICGVLLFAIGMGINIKSDYSLFSLRKNGDGEYSIPEGWLFKYVTCPNYLGELIQWIGWAIATWSLAGLSFAVWAAANLVPRARSNHQWYHENFKDYPKDRKRLIPFLW